MKRLLVGFYWRLKMWNTAVKAGIQELWGVMDILRKDLETLAKRPPTVNIQDIDTRINSVMLHVDTRLLEFQKEIYTKLFDTMESLFRYNKEIQLIDTLAKNVKDDDIGRVKSALLKPILEERWKAQNTEKTENIIKHTNTTLSQIVEGRNKLEQEKLRLEREGKDNKFVSGQLDMLDNIIKESKDAAKS